MATSPFVKRGEEVLDGFVFRPEVAQKFARVARENGALFGDEFLDGRVRGAAAYWKVTTTPSSGSSAVTVPHEHLIKILRFR